MMMVAKQQSKPETVKGPHRRQVSLGGVQSQYLNHVLENIDDEEDISRQYVSATSGKPIESMQVGRVRSKEDGIKKWQMNAYRIDLSSPTQLRNQSLPPQEHPKQP